jgi:hypothetical protein
MKNSISQSLIFAIRTEFANTICGDDVEILEDGTIFFMIETEKGRLGYAVSLLEEDDYHTVEIDVTFLSSDEQVTYYTFLETDTHTFQMLGRMQEKISWGTIVFSIEDDSKVPVLNRLDLLPPSSELKESDLDMIVKKLSLLFEEGIFLLPVIYTLSTGGSVSEQDFETDIERQHATLQ